MKRYAKEYISRPSNCPYRYAGILQYRSDKFYICTKLAGVEGPICNLCNNASNFPENCPLYIEEDEE